MHNLHPPESQRGGAFLKISKKKRQYIKSLSHNLHPPESKEGGRGAFPKNDFKEDTI